MDYIEVKFLLEPTKPFDDIISNELLSIGFESFMEQENGLSAFVLNEKFDLEKLKQCIAQIDFPDIKIDFSWKTIETQNWNAVWESNYQPILIAEKCYVRAPFHPSKADAYPFEIIIEPKMSFGTAHHETTALIIEEQLKMDFKNKNVLDMGSGTGVLSILAAKLGAKHIDAIDNDDWAVLNADENIIRNNLSDKITSIKGDADSLTTQKYDIVIANINRNILLNDMHQYAKTLDSKGELILSGFYTEDNKMLQEKSEKLGFKLISTNNIKKWSTLHLIKN